MSEFIFTPGRVCVEGGNYDGMNHVIETGSAPEQIRQRCCRL